MQVHNNDLNEEGNLFDPSFFHPLWLHYGVAFISEAKTNTDIKGFAHLNFLII